MGYLLAILAIPVLIAVFSKIFLNHTFTYIEMAIQLFITISISLVLWFTAGNYATQDIEIRNGAIVSKHIEKDTYMRSYSCRCRQSCSGTGSSRSCHTTCSTCYEKRWTKEWKAKTTIGNILFKSVDRSSSSAWSVPNPASYGGCVPGEPASLEFSFTNYVKAAPQSLFNTALENKELYTIPTYPRVTGHYKIQRVLNPSGINVDFMSLNRKLNVMLKTLGKKKQVNVIVILTSVKNRSYRRIVENDWLGGKKNDVVVFLGLSGKKVIWSDVMTWALNSGNENFVIALRNDLQQLGTYEPNKIVSAIDKNIKAKYDRPNMKDFEYLKDDIEPPMWLLLTLVLFNLIFGGICTAVFHRYDLEDFIQ